MASSAGTIRTVYNAIRNRLESDSKFKNYFKMIDYDRETKSFPTPYCRLEFINYETNPSQVSKVESPILTLGVTLIIKTKDKNRMAENLLNAVEVFENAYYGSDPTYYDGSKGLILNITSSFGGVEQLGNDQIKTEGEIINTLQHYQLGGL